MTPIYSTPTEAVNTFKKLVYYYNCKPSQHVQKYKNGAWITYQHSCIISSVPLTLTTKFKNHSIKTIEKIQNIKAERVAPQFVVYPDGTEKEFGVSKQHFIFKNNTFVSI
jgi:hypothetical protein